MQECYGKFIAFSYMAVASVLSANGIWMNNENPYLKSKVENSIRMPMQYTYYAYGFLSISENLKDLFIHVGFITKVLKSLRSFRA